MNETEQIPSIGFIADKIKTSFPNSWQAVKPKVYKDADRWHDYRRIYISFVLAVGMNIGEVPMDLAKNVSSNPFKPTSSKLLDATLHWFLQSPFDVPMFFVDKKILEAVLMTDTKFDFDWREMHLPYKSFNFIFPKGGPRLEGSEIAYLTVSRFNADDLKATAEFFGNGVGKVLVKEVFQIYVETESGFSYTKHLVDFIQSETVNKEIFVGTEPVKIFLDRLPSVVFNLLFAMAAKPEYIESGRKVGIHKKSKAELWPPNIVGLKYQTKGKNELGTHASPRLHWRRGHFREQVCGINFSKRKIIWIEPMMVGVKN